ncbi:sensor histidine kinase [Streptomyces hainanensis]|uniref:sensor histidine kinase n=1 Tax=Streptomyces hainanensis TaxID=402648 RepID=UPI001404F8E8|nr:ATP-binding protein [Streptomyces hainanensis]
MVGDGRVNAVEKLGQSAMIDRLYAQYEERLAYDLLERRDLRAEWRRQFGYVFDDCQRSMKLGRVVVNDDKVALASLLGVSTALSGISLEKLTLAWGEMFDVFLSGLTGFGAGRLLPVGRTQLALTAINRSVVERGRISSVWYEKALIKRLEGLRTADRKRAARELHDWFGSNISLALRKLELHDLTTESKEGFSRRHIEDLHSILGNLFEGVRRLSSGLRLQTPVSNIDRELRSYVDAYGLDLTDVTIFVDGDEADVPSHIRGEVFLVLRECMRNIFTHAGAGQALIMLQLSPSRVCAVVQDDGRGFAAQNGAEGSTTGSGLISMKERIRALGGTFNITSMPMNGTRIAFLVPLTDGPHDLA